MKHKRQTGFAVISLVLTFLMCFYMVPLSVYADAIETLTNDSQETVVTPPVSAQTEELVFEVTELREENVKHFRLSDGTFVASQYKTAVHYLDENGSWQDIDNSLSSDGDEMSTPGGKIKFSKKITGNHSIFTIHSGSGKIALSLDGAKEKTPITVSNDGKNEVKAATKLEELSTLSKITSSVRYNDILDGVDLEYVLYGNSIKENIIVKEKGDSYTYSFTLSLNNLTPSLQEDGSVVIADYENNTVYTMPAPFMYDASGEYSDDVTYSLADSGNGKYTLTVTADPNWINADGRAFPVTVDPTIEKGTKQTDIIDTYISSASPNECYNADYGFTSVKIGYDSSNGNFRTLTRLRNLPSIQSGSVITGAKYSMFLNTYNGTAESLCLTAHQIIKNDDEDVWPAYETTWNNQPSYNDEILDYNIVNSELARSFITWDITEAVKDWYNNSNSHCGIVIKANIENPQSGYSDAWCRFYSSDYTTNRELVPSYYITYVSGVGIRNDLSYQTIDLGNAGVAYIGDYTLQMSVIKDLFTSKWNNTLFSPQIVYTSYRETPWGFSWDSSVSEIESNNEIVGYVYIDTDGTEFYFTIDDSGNIIADEGNDGDYVLSIPSSFTSDSKFYSYGLTAANCVIITSPDGIDTLYYNGLPLLIAADDTEVYGDGVIEFRYSTGTSWLPSNDAGVVSINFKEGSSSSPLITVSGTTTKTITYYDNGTASDRYSLTYSNGLLTNIKFAEQGASLTSVASYSYSSNYILQMVDVKENVGCYFTITGSNSRTRYSSIEYCIDILTNPSTLSKYTINYIENEYTSYCDTNLTSTIEDDLYSKYVFDANGTVVCEYTYDSTGKVIATSNTNYKTVVLEDGSTKKSEIYAKVGVQNRNLLCQSGFEYTSSSYWLYGAGSSALSVTTNKKKTGEKALMYNSSSAVNSNAYQSVSLTANIDYTLSAYVYIDSSATISTSGGVKLQIKNSSGSQNFEGYNLSVGKGKWQRISLPVTVTVSGTYSIIVNFSGISGKVYVDDIMLEESNAPSEFNYISNGLFKNSLNGWTASSGTSYSTSSMVFPSEGTRSINVFKINGNIKNVNTISTNIPLGNSNTYMLSGFAKASSVYIADGDETRTFSLVAQIVYSDGTTETVECSFNAYVEEWQYVCTEIIPKENGVISSMNITISYNYNYGSAYFTGISLVEGEAYVYTDDATDDTSIEDDTVTNETPITYTRTTLLAELGFTSNMSFYFDANETYTIEDVIDENDVVTERYVYNSDDECVAVLLVRGDEIKITSTKTTDTTDSSGNVIGYTVIGYDELGNSTTSVYDTEDRMLSYTDANGNVTTYSYSNSETGGTYDKMSSGDTTVKYHYNTNKELINITVESSQSSVMNKYIFAYNDLGLITGIYITNSSTPIVTYSYNSNYELSAMTYANGYVISYEYDNMDRLSDVYYNGTKRFEYSYYPNGNVYRISNKVTGNVTEYIYQYDSVGSELIFSGSTLNQATYNLFDTEGYVNGSSVYFRGSSNVWVNNKNDKRNDEDGTLIAVSSSFGTYINYSYDNFERISKQTLGIGYSRNIVYSTATEGRTSDRVSSIAYKTSNGTATTTYSYDYDANGNITVVYKNNNVITSYAYDSLGQLIRENDVSSNKTYLYTYDNFGNLLIKAVYSYTAAGQTPTSPQSTRYYEYNNSVWNDRLTSYEGQTITYDALSNPLSYFNGSTYAFTWQGRELASATVGGVTSSYVYNSNGLRTQKTVGSQVCDYYWNGSQLVAMTISNTNGVHTTMMFAYDAEGSPYAMSYNGTVYYYQTDLQGNVVGLMNSYGLCAYYEYDAWGNITKIDAASNDEYYAIMANPLRYRGYIYDSDTGLYYLQSRYYDPVVGRFLNADDVMFLGATGTVLSCNLFAYCENDGVNKIDFNGLASLPFWVIKILYLKMPWNFQSGYDDARRFVLSGNMSIFNSAQQKLISSAIKKATYYPDGVTYYLTYYFYDIKQYVKYEFLNYKSTKEAFEFMKDEYSKITFWDRFSAVLSILGLVPVDYVSLPSGIVGGFMTMNSYKQKQIIDKYRTAVNKRCGIIIMTLNPGRYNERYNYYTWVTYPYALPLRFVY